MDWVTAAKDWQTLIGGVLAIVGAGIGAIFICAQTSETRRQESDRRARRHSAARAVMPLALSAICDYAKSTAQVLSRIRSRAQDSTIPTSSDYPRFPNVPSDVIGRFTELIESCDSSTAEALAEMLRSLQLHSSRLRSLTADLASSSSIVTTFNVDCNIADAAMLYARAESLFDYARGKRESASVGDLQPERAVNALNIFDLHSPSTYLIERLTKRDAELPEVSKEKSLVGDLRRKLKNVVLAIRS